jgi:hypothetical protein
MDDDAIYGYALVRDGVQGFSDWHTGKRAPIPTNLSHARRVALEKRKPKSRQSAEFVAVRRELFCGASAS